MSDAAVRPRSRRGSEQRQRQFRVTFRLGETEHAALVAASEAACLTMGTYIRSQVLAAPATTRARRRPSVEIVALAKLLGAVNRVGGNLHQLVRHANFGHLVYTEELNGALAGYREAVAAIMATLGRGP